MTPKEDAPLLFHKSLNEILDSFRNVITSILWTKRSIKEAKNFFKDHLYIAELDSSQTKESIKVDKSILNILEEEGFGVSTPLSTKTLINFYRIFTVSIKDIIWEEPDFKDLLQSNELQFLRHLRNASAHNNYFFWGSGRQRQDTLNKLPITWRGKIIEENLEGTSLYMNFMKPGDIFFLLSDISNLILK